MLGVDGGVGCVVDCWGYGEVAWWVLGTVDVLQVLWDECGGLGTCTYLALRWGWGCRGVVASFIGVDWFGCFWLLNCVEWRELLQRLGLKVRYSTLIYSTCDEYDRSFSSC